MKNSSPTSAVKKNHNDSRRNTQNKAQNNRFVTFQLHNWVKFWMELFNKAQTLRVLLLWLISPLLRSLTSVFSSETPGTVEWCSKQLTETTIADVTLHRVYIGKDAILFCYLSKCVLHKLHKQNPFVLIVTWGKKNKTKLQNDTRPFRADAALFALWEVSQFYFKYIQKSYENYSLKTTTRWITKTATMKNICTLAVSLQSVNPYKLVVIISVTEGNFMKKMK